MKKHLKYIDGNSDKFWQIEVASHQYTVTYGKNGTSGVQQTKSFDSETDALKTAEKLIGEKIKKGYSENGDVKAPAEVGRKSGKTSDIALILEAYDQIINQRDVSLLLPFLVKHAKGNLEPIRKQIKKHKRYYMTFVDLALEPGYKKTKDSNWSWGIRGDEKITEVITLSAMATFDKSDILTFDEVRTYLEKCQQPYIFEILNWAKPNWIGSYLSDRLKKEGWAQFNYKTLRYLEASELVTYDAELFTFSLSRFSIWRSEIKPREFIDFLTTDKLAYERDIPQLFNYETNIHSSNFSEGENTDNKVYITWSLVFNGLLSQNKLDRKGFIANSILIQTKDWNNNLKSFFRKLLEEIKPAADEWIVNQDYVFSFFNSANPTIVNYGTELVKKKYDHPRFKGKNYLDWCESLMMRSDCKAAIKSTLMTFEKLHKVNPKLSKAMALLVADVYIIADLNLQQRATKLLLKIGSEKDSALAEKLASYTTYMQGSVKPGLSRFLSEEDMTVSEFDLETYKYTPSKVGVLVDPVTIPKDWNDILFLISRFIASDDVIDAETILQVFIAQRHLFPADYNRQLQPYLKQLEAAYFQSVLKNYIKNMLVNKIADREASYTINDRGFAALNTLKLARPISQKALQKNATASLIPLLSFPTHKPYWVAPKTLIERLIQYQNKNETIDMVDWSIAISRMPRENVAEAIPLLDQLVGETKDLMAYCLGVSNALKVDATSIISKLFQKVTGPNQNAEKLALWAVAARTFYPDDTFPEFEKTNLKGIPFVSAPFVPELGFKEQWNEWKNYQTKEIERSPSWMELTYPLPSEKPVPQNFIYSLDLHPKKEKHSWYSEYVLGNESNVCYWNSLMPQNNEPLACLLLHQNCKTASGPTPELKGFLSVANQAWFQFSDTSMLVFACCFFQEKKELRLRAAEVLINRVDQKTIDVDLFADKLAFLISNKYSVLLRLVDSITVMKDVSALHNSALFLVLDGIFKNVTMPDKLPPNFKKMVESYVDLSIKTNHKPSAEAITFFESYKEIASLKPLLKQISSLAL